MSIYKRFSIDIDLQKAQVIFCNKINNLLRSGVAFDLETTTDISLSWELCNKLGLTYTSIELWKYFTVAEFNIYLLHLQCLLNILFINDHSEQYDVLLSFVQDAIDNSPIDLGLRLKTSKRNSVQIHPSGSKMLDKELVDDILGVLSGKEKHAIKISFEKGLKEFMESRNDTSKLKNSMRDMQVACDETIKYRFKDKNIGLKHLFKDNRWITAGLNNYQKNIYWNMNEYMDKYAKHSGDKEFNNEDIENIIYLTGMFVRIILLKNKDK